MEPQAKPDATPDSNNAGATPASTTAPDGIAAPSGAGSLPDNGHAPQSTTPSVLAMPLLPGAQAEAFRRKRGRPSNADRAAGLAPPKKGSAPSERVRRVNPSPDADASAPGAPGAPQATPKAPTDYKGMAQICVTVTTSGLVQVFGQEWLPSSEENTALTDATAAYLKSINMTDIPPGWMLLLVVSMYALPRVTAPGFAAKFGLSKPKPNGADHGTRIEIAH
jgi:hypothetical protein